MGKRQTKTVEIPAGRLWPNTPSGAAMNIKIMGATGPITSGKSLLGASIATGVHPGGHPFEGQPRTRCYDAEESTVTYAGIQWDRISVGDEMQNLFGCKQYQPIDVFNWWWADVMKIKPGQFDVIMLDTASDFELGQAALIKKSPEAFGLTANEIARAAPLYWAAVKEDWKQRLLKITAKCQTFFFTTHLRQQFEGNRPIPGKYESKGKQTLKELVSLYLWLEREPEDKFPSAITVPPKGKQRIADTWVGDDGELHVDNLLPPRIPVASIQAIRGYIAHGTDYAKLKAAEQVPLDVMSEDDRAQIKLATVVTQKEVEELSLARLNRQIELKEMAKQETAAKPQSPDQTAQRQKRKADAESAEAAKLKAEAETDLAAKQAEGDRLLAGNDGIPNAENRPTENQIQRISKLCRDLSMTPEFYRENFLAKVNAKKTSDLTRQQCDKLLKVLGDRAAKNLQGGPGDSEIPF